MSNQQSVDKNKRREEARARALEIQKENERRERRSRLIILLSVIVGVAVVVALVAVILSKAPKDIDPNITSMPSDVSAPAAANDQGGITIYKNEAVASVDENVPVFDLYLDFMCSHCAQFEATHSDFLMEKQASGDMAFRVHPISILNSNLATVRGSVYSYLLGLNVDQAQQYASWAYQNQGNSIDGQTTIDFLTGIGVSSSDAKAATKGDYERFVDASSMITINNKDLRDAEGSFGTPAYFFNGDRININYTDAEGLQSEITTLIADANK